MSDCQYKSENTLAVMSADPGIHGAFCIMDIDGTILDLTPRHKTRRELRDYLTHWRDAIRIAYVERVGAMPGDGKVGSFSFGQGYGEILMGLECVGILYDLVDPRVWQASMKCMTGGNKAITRRKAESLWPGRKWTNTNSDSCLIAEWARRTLLDAQAQKLKRMGR